MNKVDTLIREMLLAHPMLYANRVDALLELFTNSGYEWDETGCIVRYRPEERPVDRMDYSDLDARLKRLDEEEFREILAAIRQQETAEIELERLTRQHREANIDIYAQARHSDARVPYEKLRYLHMSHLTDASWRAPVPFGKMDADWLKAAEELIDVLKYSFNRTFDLHFDHPIKGKKAPEPSMFSQMPSRFQLLYKTIQEIDDKLDAQSGRRARAAEFMRRINLDDLRTDD